MLDINGKIAGTADYDPFGRPNRVSFNGTQASTYANNLSDQIQWEMRQTPEPMMSVRMRLHFQLNDTSQAGNDYAEVKDIDTGQVLASTTMWTMMTPWLPTQAGHIGLFMNSDGANCCPTQGGWPDCGCPQAPNYPFKGIVPEAYEYQRFQMGATPFWTPLGFPGQYHDSDTGLEENWNRFYFAPVGYLQPEPLLRSPLAHVLYAYAGHSLPVYGYALNNPIGFYDPNGLWVLPAPGDTNFWKAVDRLNQSEAGRKLWQRMHYERPQKIPFKSMREPGYGRTRDGREGDVWGRATSPNGKNWACQAVTNPDYSGGANDPALNLAEELSHIDTELDMPNSPDFAKDFRVDSTLKQIARELNLPYEPSIHHLP